MEKNIFIIMLFILTFIGCSSKIQPDKLIPHSLIGSCEEQIHLFDQKSKWAVEKERAYINFKFNDKYPSKKSFFYLEKQMIICGWKLLEGDNEFFKGTPDWMYFIEKNSDDKINLIHQFGKYYIDRYKKRIATILILYISKSNNIEELQNSSEPNNDTQHITVQINIFSEKENKKLKMLILMIIFFRPFL
jgi:hypothetical protein